MLTNMKISQFASEETENTGSKELQNLNECGAFKVDLALREIGC